MSLLWVGNLCLSRLYSLFFFLLFNYSLHTFYVVVVVLCSIVALFAFCSYFLIRKRWNSVFTESQSATIHAWIQRNAKSLNTHQYFKKIPCLYLKTFGSHYYTKDPMSVKFVPVRSILIAFFVILNIP